MTLNYNIALKKRVIYSSKSNRELIWSKKLNSRNRKNIYECRIYCKRKMAQATAYIRASEELGNKVKQTK